MPVPPRVVEALIATGESHGVVRRDDGLEIGQKVRIFRNHSRRPFVVSRVWTTVGTFTFYSKSWVWK
jgi:hypothetical protein